MLIKRKRGWEIPESKATPEAAFWNRRKLLAGIGLGTMASLGAGLGVGAGLGLRSGAARAAADPTADLYPAMRNPRYRIERALTDEAEASRYNNFYEFGSHKQIHRLAQDLKIRPWTVTIDGMVEQTRTIDIDTLIRQMSLEERLYRHRCVEAWSMTVPWTGFGLAALVDFARPLGSAKYVMMETFLDTEVAPGQKQFWYPWPYREGLTLAEARNELSFLVTGIYGRPMAKQFGAPLRLAVPWKYGFKSIKSIVRFHFTDERPVSFWEKIQAKEYGFWANVNPKVPHPRWSQASERVLGTDGRVPTQLYNGYGEFVAGLYSDLEKTEKRRLFM